MEVICKHYTPLDIASQAIRTCWQILALEIAMRLNHDVDHPRNLAKSVTVE
ncbi:hypothetical protein HpKG90_00170 [Helicobacter pylori]